MVDSPDLFVVGRGVRPAGHHGNSGPIASFDDRRLRATLHDHGGRKNQVGPFQVRVLQSGHVHVHDTEVVARREHRGDGEQPQWGKDRPDSNQVQGILRSPVGRRMLGVHQQGVRHGYRFIRSRCGPMDCRTAGFDGPRSGSARHPLRTSRVLRHRRAVAVRCRTPDEFTYPSTGRSRRGTACERAGGGTPLSEHTLRHNPERCERRTSNSARRRAEMAASPVPAAANRKNTRTDTAIEIIATP